MSESAAGFPQRIVHTDDDIAVRKLVRHALERYSEDVVLVTCGTGDELLQRFRELQPDLILLDLVMPGMDGPEVIEKLRQMPEAATTPIIFLTAKSKIEMVGDYSALGVIGVIHKPFVAPEFADTIQEMWQKHQEKLAG